MANSEPVHINSFVVLDLETTGLPRLIFRTKITEISILGIERSHILQSFGKKQFNPRVVQKLNLCIYPNKLINPSASEVSGLSNEILENCKKFDEDVFDVLLKVINFLPPPVCLLAHNGNGFDFPILQSEINHIGKALPDDIYCADTLPAFRILLKETSDLQNDIVSLDLGEVCSFDHPIEVDETDLGIDLPVDDALDVTYVEDLNSVNRWDSWDQKLNQITEEVENEYIRQVQGVNFDELKRLNETTPKSSRKSHEIKKILVHDEMIISGCMKFRDIKKQLFPNKGPKTRKQRFGLQDCFKQLTGKQIVNAHRADSDTHALLECVVALGPPLLEWIDNNCKPFNTIKKLW